jgi:hypothetical protein
LTSKPTAADLAGKNVKELETSRRPEVVVDGLGLLNPELSAERFAALRLDGYSVAGRTRMSIIYVTKR